MSAARGRGPREALVAASGKSEKSREGHQTPHINQYHVNEDNKNRLDVRARTVFRVTSRLAIYKL